MRFEAFIFLLGQSLAAVIFNLTSSTFDSFLRENPLVLVHFNAPWCSACKKAAQILNEVASDSVQGNSALKMASVDLSKDPPLNERFEFAKLPTLKLFFYETPITYAGKIDSGDIRKWLSELFKNDIEELFTADGLNEALKKRFAVLLCTPITNKRQIFAFKALKSGNPEIEFLYSQMTNFRFMNRTNDSVHLVFIRDFDDGTQWFSRSSDFQFSEMEELLLQFKEPFLLAVGEENFNRVMRQYKSLVVRFTDSNSTASDSEFERLSQLYGSTVKFSRLSSADGFGKSLFRFANIPPAESTSTYLFSARHRKFEKFKLSGSELDEATFVEALNNYFEGKLKPYLASEEVPTESGSAVKKVVGRSFDKAVRGSKRCFLLMVVSQNCCDCESGRADFEKIASRAGDDSQVDFGILDASKNEVSGLSFTVFPSYYLFGPKLRRSGERFFGPLSEETIAEFVKLKAGIALLGNQKSEGLSDEL